MKEDAIENAALISYNYPKSEWYKLSYNLINKDNQENRGIFNKISNFLNINETKE